MKRYCILATTILVTLSCHHKTQQQTAIPPMEIEVFVASAELMPQSVEFVGQTYSNYDISIQPRVSGFLSSRHYSNGMPVSRGQLIYTIDPSQLNTSVTEAKANLFSAEAKLVEAQNNYRRAIPLAEINAVSQLTLDQYKAEYLSAEASRSAAKASLRNAEINLSYANIYSPIDGIIAESNASIGDYVGVGTEFTVLTKISSVDTITCHLPMPVSEYLLYRRRAGVSSPTYENDSLLSNIRLTLSDGSQYPHSGFYQYTKKDIGEDMGVIIFVVGFDNSDAELKIGQYAKVTAELGREQQIIAVPQRAISQTQNINSLWIMKADSTVEYREVDLGDTNGNMWVVDSGLEQGDVVLLEGSLKLKNGMKIEPKYQSNRADSSNRSQN